MRRLSLAVGIVLAIALLAFVGRRGYSDADGTPLSILDSIYYATVTVTTTGYGDIAPISPSARAVTAFIVTPLRVVFLILLVGTTLELLTERYRLARARTKWRERVDGHTIVVGYGAMGASAVQTLRAEGIVPGEGIVVIDHQHRPADQARDAGLVTIVGDATRTETLREACVERARAVIVTCNRDDTAALVTLTARELNPTAIISAAVREQENAHLLAQSGASDVVLSSAAAGRLIGLSTAVGVLQDLLTAGQGLEIAERVAAEGDIGRLPDRSGPGLPIAIVRGGRRIPFGAAAATPLQRGDVIVSIVDRADPA
jgi:voltage-gated potassium channel